MAIVFLVLVVVFFVVWRIYKRLKRKAAIEAPFPLEWTEILQNNYPVYQKLPPDLKDNLHQKIQTFLFDKLFEGCGGQEITDEIRVMIAAQACMLIVNRDVECYPRLRTVLVYPTTYVAKEKESFNRDKTSNSVRLGESWTIGTVVLAWDSVKKDAFKMDDGHNVTMHEFAHQLDQEDGYGDGIPVLGHYSAYSLWAEIFLEEFERLKQKTLQGKDDILDQYGATNPAEFFAVATETFFERPEQLSKAHPGLFKELEAYYQINPLTWTAKHLN